jgi:hypothetical protein
MVQEGNSTWLASWNNLFGSLYLYNNKTLHYNSSETWHITHVYSTCNTMNIKKKINK